MSGQRFWILDSGFWINRRRRGAGRARSRVPVQNPKSKIQNPGLRAAAPLLLLLGALLLVAGCGSGLNLPPERAFSEPAERDLFLAQIIDAADRPREAAALEGEVYAWLLRRAAATSPGELTRAADPDWTYEGLTDRPATLRGAAVAFRGLVCEVAPAEPLPPEVIRAAFGEAAARLVVERAFVIAWGGATERYELRYVRSAGLPARQAGELVNVGGFFLKQHVYANAGGELRAVPLLVGPRPEICTKYGVRIRLPIEEFFSQSLGLNYRDYFPTHAAPGGEVIGPRLVVAVDGAEFLLDGRPVARADLEVRLSSGPEPGPVILLVHPNSDAAAWAWLLGRAAAAGRELRVRESAFAPFRRADEPKAASAEPPPSPLAGEGRG